jgi:chromosome segregation ATPase
VVSDERKRVVAKVDANTHEVLKRKLDHGELSALIRDIANTVAFGDEWDRQTLIEQRIESKREELRDLRDQRRSIEGKIETVEERIRDLERKRDQIETQEDQYEGALWSFEQSFRAGEFGHLDEGHPRLTSLAAEFDTSPADLHADLRERNPDVPDFAFKPPEMNARSALSPTSVSKKFTGLPEEQVATPVEERGGPQ